MGYCGKLLKFLKVTKHPFTTGTWNIRTLYAKGRVKELTHELERYKWDVFGLSEVRWTGCGKIVTEEGHKLWLSGENKDHVNGVGFIVNKSYLSMVMECKMVSRRIISIRVGAKPKNLTIIQVYLPTTSHSDSEIEQFYDELEKKKGNFKERYFNSSRRLEFKDRHRLL